MAAPTSDRGGEISPYGATRSTACGGGDRPPGGSGCALLRLLPYTPNQSDYQSQRYDGMQLESRTAVAGVSRIVLKKSLSAQEQASWRESRESIACNLTTCNTMLITISRALAVSATLALSAQLRSEKNIGSTRSSRSVGGRRGQAFLRGFSRLPPLLPSVKTAGRLGPLCQIVKLSNLGTTCPPVKRLSNYDPPSRQAPTLPPEYGSPAPHCTLGLFHASKAAPAYLALSTSLPQAS